MFCGNMEGISSLPCSTLKSVDAQYSIALLFNFISSHVIRHNETILNYIETQKMKIVGVHSEPIGMVKCFSSDCVMFSCRQIANAPHVISSTTKKARIEEPVHLTSEPGYSKEVELYWINL